MSVDVSLTLKREFLGRPMVLAVSGAPWKGDLGLPGAAEETDGVHGQTASGAWAGTAHNRAESKDSGDIIALTVLPGAVCGWQRGRAARPMVLTPWNDD